MLYYKCSREVMMKENWVPVVGKMAIWSRDWDEPVQVESYDEEYDVFWVMDRHGEEHEVEARDLYPDELENY
jgi:hypothetical protein